MNCIQQAQKIYEICIINAKANATMTYREVLNHLGYGPGVSGQAIRYGLELAWIACINYDLPSVTSIVVNSATGEPSSGYSVADWKKDAQAVFTQKEWPDVDEIDWDYVWENRKELSNRYGTRGYWSS
jgi:hypothetical protein